MAKKEAAARIKINRLLEESEWRFFDEGEGRPANIALEENTKITRKALDKMGDNFEKVSDGFIDYLLLDDRGFPVAVLEAKSESKHPLSGKEQARKYARAKNCRFVILSNGITHYFWDIEYGEPSPVIRFPTPAEFSYHNKYEPKPQRLIDEEVNSDYIALTQNPDYMKDPDWINKAERDNYIDREKLRFLRDYQIDAVHRIQAAVREGKTRFLFEMATGTGKTLTTAAVIKLFHSTGNARRTLFLVDRLELEKQAKKVFDGILSADLKTEIYKESRDDWQSAEIVVSTVQSLLSRNRYREVFSPVDFDLVISDEAHRSISGSARAVFEYFVGYKLGLTATPRDYLRNVNESKEMVNNPQNIERRIMLDTYRTFGCESEEPTFRYSLNDGVRDGCLISPTVIDARTDITTGLIAREGFKVIVNKGTGEEEIDANYDKRAYEKLFFSAATNRALCEAFLDEALKDPVSGEVGKSIVFAVSQKHARKLTAVFNRLARERFREGGYQSDFAVQVTSEVDDAQQLSVNFANNKLLGRSNYMEEYRTSKARICVTVGMMTTGYDCPDILNIGLFRPIFSPTDFIQIKGRGTRTHNFLDNVTDESVTEEMEDAEKSTFYLFDFFANYEYFEKDHDYGKRLGLPSLSEINEAGAEEEPDEEESGSDDYATTHVGDDDVASVATTEIGPEGMRVDRIFNRFEDVARGDENLKEAVEADDWERAADYVEREIFKRDGPFTLEKLRRAANVDRRLNTKEVLLKTFGLIPRFKSKDEILEEKFEKFFSLFLLEDEDIIDDDGAVAAIKFFFKAYAGSEGVRTIIESGDLAALYTNPEFSFRDFRDVPKRFRKTVPEYIKDRVPLNQFMP